MLNPSLRSLTCFDCGASHGIEVGVGTCRRCGGSLRVGYELTAGSRPSKADTTIWRHEAVLPVGRSTAVSLGEGGTPVLEVASGVWLKDESVNPTGSFKDRGMSVAVSVARALGAEGVAAPSAGNAAESLAAYGEAANLGVLVVVPDDTPEPMVHSCRRRGAAVVMVKGTVSDAGRWLADNLPPGYVNVATLREPFRVEGKKTMAYEMFEQLDRLPDVVVFPTGGGTGVIGIWKAFDELQQLGWIGTERPRIALVQSAGCAPIVRAFEQGRHTTEAWVRVDSGPHGLRVPDPFGGALCLRALHETKGVAVAVPEEEMTAAAASLSHETGVDVCPEGGAAWAGYLQLRESGWIGPSERVVVFNTGAGSKYSGMW